MAVDKADGAGSQTPLNTPKRPSAAAQAVRLIKGPCPGITLEPPSAGGRQPIDQLRLVRFGRHTAVSLSTAPGSRPSSRPPRIGSPGEDPALISCLLDEHRRLDGLAPRRGRGWRPRRDKVELGPGYGGCGSSCARIWPLLSGRSEVICLGCSRHGTARGSRGEQGAS